MKQLVWAIVLPTIENGQFEKVVSEQSFFFDAVFDCCNQDEIEGNELDVISMYLMRYLVNSSFILSFCFQQCHAEAISVARMDLVYR